MTQHPGYPAATAPVNPRPHVGFVQALKNWFKYMFHFSGRASRSEFWWVYGFTTVIVSVINFAVFLPLFIAYVDFLDARKGYTRGVLSQAEYIDAVHALNGLRLVVYLVIALITLIHFVSMLAIYWRRLQDANFTGLLFLLSLIGLGIVPLIMCFLPSKPEGARFDKPVDATRP